MPRTCTICNHKKRREIEIALVAGQPFRNIALQFHIGAMSVYRHQQEHLPAQLLKAREFQETAGGNDLVARLREIHQTTRSILARALAKNDGPLALKAISRLERQLELEGRLLGELEERATTPQRLEVVYIDKAIIASPGAPLPKWQQAIESRVRVRAGYADTGGDSADLRPG